MTSLALIHRCPPRRLVAEAPPWVWVTLHLALYAALDVGAMAALAASGGLPDIVAASGGQPDIVAAVAVSIAWGLPLHVALLALAAAALMVLRICQEQRWFRFRLSALAVFVLPAASLAWLLSSGDVAVLCAVTAWHLVMALLVVQPDAGWPDRRI
ncbi:hypothetical protein ACQP2X_47585 [Actinoplanes sp. CA-131856]